jgi:CRP-like cAMP-binding protein
MTTRTNDTLDRALALFDTLPAEVRPAVIERLEVCAFGKGEHVYCEGDAATGLHIVASGRLSVVAHEGAERVILASFAPGDIAGEVELVLRRNAGTDAVAVEPTATFFLARADFDALVEAHPKFAHALYVSALRKAAIATRVLAEPAAPVEVLTVDEASITEAAPIVVEAKPAEKVEAKPAEKVEAKSSLPPPLPPASLAPASLAPTAASTRPIASADPPSGARARLAIGTFALAACAFIALGIAAPWRASGVAFSTSPVACASGSLDSAFAAMAADSVPVPSASSARDAAAPSMSATARPPATKALRAIAPPPKPSAADELGGRE